MKRQLLQHYAISRANSSPDAPAVIGCDEVMTYGQLEEQSNRLANMILEIGCRHGDRICLLVDKSPAAVVAMHAVMKAGCIYIPIDGSSPGSRICKIIDSCRPRMILADHNAAKPLKEVISVLGEKSLPGIGFLETEPEFSTVFDATDLAGIKTTAPDSRGRPEDAAHILFTSGSTGTPKGVVLSHKNVCHFVDWGREYFGIDYSDRISGHPPLHFDLSTFDIYGTFSAGAQLHLVPSIANLLPASLAKFIRESELTQWFSVPSALAMMARGDVIQENDFPSLRRLLWCGEVLPTPILIHWMERLPHVEFTNLYGPTETTIASSYYTVKECPGDPREPTPIGSPCQGEDMLVLDSGLKPIPCGSRGDLYISGVGLSDGYWEDPEKTGAAFISITTDPATEPKRVYRTGDLARVGEDGLFHFLGRNDSQIKSRGFRIELGEIESALNSLGILKDCAVVGVESDGFEGTSICCAYVLPKNDSELPPHTLRTQLSKLVPGYMLPKHWQELQSMPKTGNGKCNRRQIKALFGELIDKSPPDKTDTLLHPISSKTARQ